jgi:hypothetical protein
MSLQRVDGIPIYFSWIHWIAQKQSDNRDQSSLFLNTGATDDSIHSPREIQTKTGEGSERVGRTSRCAAQQNAQSVAALR